MTNKWHPDRWNPFPAVTPPEGIPLRLTLDPMGYDSSGRWTQLAAGYFENGRFYEEDGLEMYHEVKATRAFNDAGEDLTKISPEGWNSFATTKPANGTCIRILLPMYRPGWDYTGLFYKNGKLWFGVPRKPGDVPDQEVEFTGPEVLNECFWKPWDELYDDEAAANRVVFRVVDRATGVEVSVNQNRNVEAFGARMTPEQAWRLSTMFKRAADRAAGRVIVVGDDSQVEYV